VVVLPRHATGQSIKDPFRDLPSRPALSLALSLAPSSSSLLTPTIPLTDKLLYKSLDYLASLLNTWY
ncbi:hypothetical protein L249_0393, partial [Ophiocordyceps polyrhachis-furcata BCC 54312]